MSGAPELGHRIEGKYQLERFLGQGAAGAVYEATNEALI